MPYCLFRPTLWCEFYVTLGETLLLILPDPEPIPLLSCPTSSPCISTPSSIKNFSTKFFSNSSPSWNSLLPWIWEHTPGPLPTSRSLFLNLFVDSSFSTHFFSHPTPWPCEYISPQNSSIYLVMFWKHQLVLLICILQISTWFRHLKLRICNATIYLFAIFTVLLRCHQHSLSHWSQKSEHDPCSPSSKPNLLDVTTFCPFYSVNNC